MKVNALRHEDGSLRPDSYVVCSRSQGGCGGLKRNLGQVEAYVRAVIRERLATLQPVDDVPEGTASTQEAARLEAAIETLQARLTATQEAHAVGDLDTVDFVASTRLMRERLAQHRHTLAAVAAARPADLGADPLADWDAGDEDRQQAIADGLVEGITLMPTGKVGPVRARAMVPETTRIAFK